MRTRIAIAVGIAVLAAAAAAGYLIMARQAERAARQQVESAALRIPGVKSVDYDAVSIDWLASKARIRRVRVVLSDPEETVPIDEILVNAFEPGQGVPERLDVEVRGVRLRSGQPRLQALQPYLASAGYEELAVDLRLDYTYDPSTRLLTIETLAVDIARGGSLTLSARLNNIDLPRLMERLDDTVYLFTSLPAVSLAAAELAYVDDTLARRLLEEWARRTHSTPVEAAGALNADLDRLFGRADRQPTREALSALKSFIASPGRLRVAAEPPSPVSFLRFLWAGSPSEVLELLHLRVKG